MYQRTRRIRIEESKWRPLNRDEGAEGRLFMSLIMPLRCCVHQNRQRSRIDRALRVSPPGVNGFSRKSTSESSTP
jgi:hypothetical protein